jgi:hypothetical protein
MLPMIPDRYVTIKGKILDCYESRPYTEILGEESDQCMDGENWEAWRPGARRGPDSGRTPDGGAESD